MRPRGVSGSVGRLSAQASRRITTGKKQTARRLRGTDSKRSKTRVRLLQLSLPLASGLALGGAAVFMESRGVASRPALAAGVIALGAATGLLPLRFALPIAIVLASLQGFLTEFVGTRAGYWNESFLVALGLRSLLARRPDRAELAALAVLAGACAAYLVAGTSAHALFWATKVLLTAVVATWAVARLAPRRHEWLALYHGLAIAVAANLVLAIWQRARGIDGLVSLGMREQLKQASAGSLRAFGGFTSPSPFSYFLAISLLCWIALLANKRDRKVAVATAWLPVAAALGMAWSSVRLTAVAFTVVVLLGVAYAVGRGARVRALAGVASLALLIGGAIAVAGTSHDVLEGFTFGSDSARARIFMWDRYGAHLSWSGSGPASAGSAYEHVSPPGWRLPLDFAAGWTPFAYEHGHPVRWMGESASLLAGVYLSKRPQLIFSAHVKANGHRERLRVFYHSQTPAQRPRLVLATTVGVRAGTDVRVRIPRGRGSGILELFSVRPERVGQSGANYGRRLKFEGIRLLGLPPPRSPAEKVYAEAFDDVLDATSAGVVDNLFLSWLFQYGFVGGAILSVAWVGLLLAPWRMRVDASATVAARLTGVFVVVAALGVNVWEEFPTDLAAGLILAAAFGCRRLPKRGAT